MAATSQKAIFTSTSASADGSLDHEVVARNNAPWLVVFDDRVHCDKKILECFMSKVYRVFVRSVAFVLCRVVASQGGTFFSVIQMKMLR